MAVRVKYEHIEALYQRYPKKKGKSRGMRIALTQCRTEDDLSLLAQAIDNYTKHLVQEGTEMKFVLYFSSFMSQWRDWACLEEDIPLTQKVNLDGIDFD